MKIFNRVLAIIAVIVLVALFVLVFILGITGSEYFPVALLMCVIVPVLFYGISLMTKVLSTKGEKMKQENANETKDESNNVEK